MATVKGSHCYFKFGEPMKFNQKKLKKAARIIIETLGYSLDDPNFKSTPDRFARSMSELILSENKIKHELEKLKVEFPTRYNGMIFAKNIRVYSWCPHHILPVEYDCHIGYIPSKENGKALGASKLARVADILSRRMVLQEDLIMDIADFLEEKVNPDGIAIVMDGIHSCMKIRGIKQQNSSYNMSEMRGSFKENDNTRNEFFHLIGKW
jgi:GTP cyclohydrolase IA